MRDQSGHDREDFERLFQASDPESAGRKGLGLGLHICKELVTRQGGNISANSTTGKGSVFSVTLPIFSLANLIAPLLANQILPAGSVVLMSVEIGSQNGWLSNDNREAWSRESRVLIQTCLLPDLDMLLPKMNAGGGPSETFYVLVFADEIGAGVLAKRIREQFGHLEQLKKAGLIVSVSYKFLNLVPAGVGTQLEDTIEKTASRIGTLIKSEINTRSIHYE